MRRLSGQAALGCAIVLHWLATLAITLAVLAGTALAAISWRLSQGPLELPWLTSRLEAAANSNGGPTKLAIGSVALAWEGFRRGVDRPLDLKVTDVTVIDQVGGRSVSIPSAAVSLSLYELLRGHVALRAADVDGAHLTLERAADGTLSVDIGSLAEAADAGQPPSSNSAPKVADMLAELARPIGSDRDRRSSLFDQLREVRVHDASVVVVDRQLGVTWTAPRAEIDLRRRANGGADGTANLSLALGDQQARLNLEATLAAGATETSLRARLSPVTPSALARAAPSLGFLAAVNAPVAAEASFNLDAHLVPRAVRFSLHATAGTVRIQDTDVPIVDAVMAASATPDSLDLQTFRIALRGHPAAPLTHIETHGTVERDPGEFIATLSLEIDQVDFADLNKFWPDGIGRHARRWIVENITSGIAHNGHVNIGLAASPDLSSIDVTSAKGTLDGDRLEVHWLRPILPIDDGKAQLRIVDPDTLDIAVAAGRQELRNSASGLQIRSGLMHITGIMQPHQVGVINADIDTSLPDAIALLREPRLELLSRHSLPLSDPSGQARVKLAVTLPLEANVTMDDVAIRAKAHLQDVHLSAVAAGRNLDQGEFDLDADTDSMKLTGRGDLAAIPVDLDGVMDFRAGPPTQAQQVITVSGKPTFSQLAAAGLDATSVLNGPASMRATLTERRNGSGDLAVSADLTGTTMAVSQIEWRKPNGVAARASARVLLDHDRLVRIDNIQLDGDEIALRGQGTFTDGQLTLLQVDRLVLGRTSVQGSLRLPRQPGAGPIVVNCSGQTMDLAARLSRVTPPHKPKNNEEPPPGPRWTFDARFDRLLMAHDVVATGVVLHAENDGRLYKALRLEGQTGGRAPFSVQILPERQGRRLVASATDAGNLLRGLDYVRDMDGGTLALQANYNDADREHPLAGTVRIDDFRMHNAPAFGKLLQAMTLYGVVDALRGPGLGFSHMETPFRLTEHAIDIDDARAFSASLGLTAKGHIDLDMQQVDMQGTIVPAYFFNSLLGNVPILGRLFSPERGGGVFAASYAVHGPLDDPSVSVNPLSALTPGFLRGLFRLF